ncbi:MAG: GntR family transcriptional regulator [bacterium]
MTTTPLTSGIPPRSKLAEVCQQLAVLARQKRPGDRLPTVQALCERFDASWGTLDRALTELERRGVLERQHGRGIFVAAEMGHATLGVLLGIDVGAGELSPYYRLVLDAARAEAERRGQEIRFYVSWSGRQDRASLLQQLQLDVEAGLVHALVLVGTGTLELPWASEHGVPVVSLSMVSAGPRVVIDAPEIVRTGMQALVATGCRRLALLGGDEMVEQFRRELRQMDLEDVAARRISIHAVSQFDKKDNSEQVGFELHWVLVDRVTLPARRWLTRGAADAADDMAAALDDRLGEYLEEWQ